VTLKPPVTEEFKQFSDSMKEVLNYPNSSVAEYDDYVNPFILYHYDAMILTINGLIRLVTYRR